MSLFAHAVAGIPAVREPAAQGTFYPDDPAELTRQVDGFLAAPSTAAPLPPGRVRAVIAPHAGYIYSGALAARALRLLPADTRRVIVLAPSHHVGFDGAALPGCEVFHNALGNLPLDTAACTALAGQAPTLFHILPEAHAEEHALEVMLPFLQRHLKRFTLVPVVVGQRFDAERIARALAPLLDDPGTALVASSDLSHYHPYAAAKRLDQACLDRLLALDAAGLQDQELCGVAPVTCLVALAKAKGWTPALVGYCNSGDTAGDKGRVVGYGAVAFVESAAARKAAVAAAPAAAPSDRPAAGAGTPPLLSPAQQQALLAFARETIAAKLAGRPLPDLPVDGPLFRQKLGCFVTLHLDGDLRGCIGNIFPVQPLARAVRENALNAAFDDPRFPPLTAGELPRCHLEISVLTQPEPLPYADAAELLARLKPNVHGVVLRQGYNQSTFLPQVWEQLPRKEAFLEHLCLKGGMAPDAWRDPRRMEVQTYQAFVFGEPAR